VLTLTLKNVVPHSVATAFASSVFPVPGGPYNNTPLHGLLIPQKNSGIQRGRTTASSRRDLAVRRPAMVDQGVEGGEERMSRLMESIREGS
jgi:hypothetical protein